VLFLGAGRAEVQRARRVGRAVEVLRARVAEVDGVRVDGGAGAGLRLVVDDGGICARRGDGVEGETDKALVFPMGLVVSKGARRGEELEVKSYVRICFNLSAAWTSLSLAFLLINWSSRQAKNSVKAAPSLM
jgi:hypothetical protein